MGIEPQKDGTHELYCDVCGRQIEEGERFHDVDDRFLMEDDKVSEPTVHRILCYQCMMTGRGEKELQEEGE